jgi:hypothetical protein
MPAYPSKSCGAHFRKLIGRYLSFYQSLDLGSRKPATDQQRRFVAVCRGKLPPITDHEHTYLWWRKISNRKLPSTTPGSASPADPDPRDLRLRLGKPFIPSGAREGRRPPPGRWADPKPYARFISEPLGTREDFKRDSGANWSNSRRPK